MCQYDGTELLIPQRPELLIEEISGQTMMFYKISVGNSDNEGYV